MVLSGGKEKAYKKKEGGLEKSKTAFIVQARRYIEKKKGGMKEKSYFLYEHKKVLGTKKGRKGKVHFGPEVAGRSAYYCTRVRNILNSSTISAGFASCSSDLRIGPH